MENQLRPVGKVNLLVESLRYSTLLQLQVPLTLCWEGKIIIMVMDMRVARTRADR